MGKYRKVAREISFRTLFAYDFRKDEDIFEILEEVIKDVRPYLPTKIIDYSYKIIANYEDNRDTVDELIKKNLKNWRLERLGYPERAFIRLGVVELLYSTIDDKGRVFIDILDLAKCYIGIKDSLRFINGVLSSIYKSERPSDYQNIMNNIDIEEYIKENFKEDKDKEKENEISDNR